MLQAYSTNVDIAANSAVPFNNVVLDKGCAEALSAPATIQLNKRGVYLVEFDGYALGDTAAGVVTFQLYVNGVAQPQAISSFTAVAVTDVYPVGFKTFVQVTENNCNCNLLSSPTVLQVRIGDTAVSDAHVNIVVTKIV